MVGHWGGQIYYRVKIHVLFGSTYTCFGSTIDVYGEFIFTWTDVTASSGPTILSCGFGAGTV